MYNCGPTAYDYFHVGNARNFICADVIRRYLEYRGYEVRFAQNITDIDDKIINRAKEEGVSAARIAEKYTKAFFASASQLGVREADFHPRATQYVEKMIDFARRLIEKGCAYEVEGDVYFRVSRFKEYGKLSGCKIDELLSGARVEVSEKKESPVDFALWKAAKEGEPSWPSPWGPGRPGWHLECSVMSMDLLGESFDIHMGGPDLIFPHHENEIAQCEALTGKPFVKYWIHNGFLNIDGEKMSKSLGNFFTIDQVLEQFEPSAVRYFLLSAHYRVPLDFSDAALREAASALGRLREARVNARRLTEERSTKDVFRVEKFPVTDAAEELQSSFVEAMNDDFNTPRALAALFEAAGRINQIHHKAIEIEKTGGRVDDADRAEAAQLDELLDELASGVLGLDLGEPRGEAIEDLSGQLLDLLIEVRSMARREKQWALADLIRDGLGEIGFQLTDLPSGTEWRRI
jgi:cysteinyl-tRNA synthetase